MRSVIVDIPDKLFNPAENKSFSGLFDAGVITQGPDVYDFKTPLSWNVDITNTGDGLLVTGEVQGKGRVNCSRCLEAYDQEIVGDVEGFFLLPNKPVPSDLEGDEYEVLTEDQKADLAPAIMQAIRISLPDVPLCKPDCKGLCPICGTNWNYHTCDCAEKQAKKEAEEKKTESPFAVLSQLKFDENGKAIGTTSPDQRHESDISEGHITSDVPDFNDTPHLS